MYKIFYKDSDETMFLDDTSLIQDYQLINTKLKMSVNAAGSLEFEMPTTNIMYNGLNRMKGLVKVTKKDRLIWEGRVLSEDTDFWKNKKVYCEGILSCLNDTHQPQQIYRDLPLRSYMESILSIHNQKVDDSKRFEVGIVTVNNNSTIGDRTTNYETTWELLDSLIKEFGGYLFVRYDNGHRYIDYRKEVQRTSSQKIEFGTNLIDFTKKYDMSTLCTVVLPLGARVDSDDEVFEHYTTVESVNDGSMYIKNDTAVSNYGWIERQITWDNISDPAQLKSVAETYLRDGQFDEMSLELTAIDLALMGVQADDINLVDEVLVISEPHGLNKTFPVTELEIGIGNQAGTSFRLGFKTTQTLSGTVGRANEEMLAKLNEIPSRSAILESAKQNATMLINNAVSGIFKSEYDQYGVTTGFRISNISDWESDDAYGWRFNIGGLGYYGNGFNNPVTLAITGEDGGIVANCITTGTMYADRIRGGSLILGGYNNDNGVAIVRDSNGNDICRLDNTGAYINGVVYSENKSTGLWTQMSNGSITGGDSNGILATIDTSAGILDGDHGILYKGLQISSDVIYFDCEFFAINGATGTTGGLTLVDQVSFTMNSVEVVTDVHLDNNNELQIETETIEYISGYTVGGTTFYFKNGIMCTELDDDTDVGSNYNAPQRHGTYDRGSGGDQTPVDGGAATSLLAKLKLTDYETGQTQIENLGIGGHAFVASSKGGTLSNDISQSDDGIRVNGKGQLGIYCDWSLTKYTIIIQLHINSLSLGNMYSRIIANHANQFEIFIPKQSSGSPYPNQLTFTIAQGSNMTGNPIDGSVHTVPNFSTWLTCDDVTSSSLVDRDVTFRLVNDGARVTLYIDDISLAYIDATIFRQYNREPFIGVGTVDYWNEAASTDVVIKRFEIYDGLVKR